MDSLGQRTIVSMRCTRTLKSIHSSRIIIIRDLGLVLCMQHINRQHCMGKYYCLVDCDQRALMFKMVKQWWDQAIRSYVSLHISFELSPVHSFTWFNHCLAGLPRAHVHKTFPRNMIFGSVPFACTTCPNHLSFLCLNDIRQRVILNGNYVGASNIYSARVCSISPKA